MNKKILALSLTALSLVIVSEAKAETSFRPGIVDRKIEIPQLPTSKPQTGVIQGPSVDDYKGSNRPLPVINTVTFNGPTVMNGEELSAITQPYLDRPITENDIAQLKNDITNAYARKGYSLVKVATPSQDLQDGELTINIYEGKVGEVVVQSNGVIADRVPQAFAARMNKGVFDEKVAEGVINDLNEINNTNSNLTLRPGREPITSDIILNVQNQPGEDKNYVAVDNYGNKLTGVYQGSAHLEKSNAFGLGEKLTADGRVTNDKLYGGNVGYKVPTGFRNTYLEGGYGYSENQVGDRLAFLNADGNSHTGYVDIAGNVINYDNQKLTLKGGLEGGLHRSYLNDILDTKDNIRRAFAQATYLGLAPSTAYLVDAKISKGLNILGASQAGDRMLSRAQGDPEAWIFQPSIFGRHNLTPNDAISAFLQGQYATNKLLSPDLFTLGGYGSVRGFQPAQEAGESGYAYQLEYQHKFPLTDTTRLGVGPWFDGGTVLNKIKGQTTDKTLLAAGIGAELGADLIPQGETTVRVDWAHPVGNYDSPQVDNNSFYFRVQQDF